MRANHSLVHPRMPRRVPGAPMRLARMLVVAAAWVAVPLGAHAQAVRFAGPTSSQPLALSADGAFLVVANPDSNTVSFFDLRGDRNRRVAEVPVQTEPNGVAYTPDGRKAYVANTASGTVSVIDTNIANGVIQRPRMHIRVGTEPYGLALTPNGRRLYVTNARSHSVSVIDTATDTVQATIGNVGVEPRGIAITNDGDADDDDELVYVTQFLGQRIPGRVDGRDDAKSGRVTILSTSTQAIVGSVVLNPVADTGFKAAGDALARIPPGAGFTFTTGAYPNQLNGIAIRGNFAFVPSTGASPNGPVRFDVNTHSLLSVIDRLAGVDAGKTINLHAAVRDQLSPLRRFLTQPWAIAFKHGADQAYVVSAASDVVVKLATSAADGLAVVQSDPLDPTRVLQVATGRNPRGIVVNAADTRAYVMNYVSRDITVIDLTGPVETAMATVRSSALPAPGSLAERVHVGRELYNTSVGQFDPAPGTTDPIVGRMSAAGWGSCAACHTPFGLSDNVVWIFASGPRRTIAQHTDFDRSDPTRSIQRALNWSAIFDEQSDFELNIRNVSGGLGLIVEADGVTPASVAAFNPANTGRNQLKVRGIGAWDALKAFVQFGIRPPISAVAATEPDVVAGRALFTAANCQQCHGGAQWTSSRVRFTPPPPPGAIVAGQIAGELRSVGTFDPALLNEVTASAGVPLGASGFAPASLLSLHAFSQAFLHNGSAISLDEVLNSVTHRSAGTSGVDVLSNPGDRAKIARFLLSIDASTTPIP
jgi:YVTN family beta-propeller protein